MAKSAGRTPVPPRNWHRLFGLLLSEHLAGSPFVVELEKDLSQKRQLLDVIIVRRAPGELRRPLPDGLDQLVDHNLITFKSFRETLDDWALKELTGHYVNYRKQVSGRDPMLPESMFALFAICSRTPRELFDEVTTDNIQPGVYVCRRGSDAIHIVVAGELPKAEHNAFLHLFSAVADRIKYGAEHYSLPSADVSTIVNQLYANYQQEGLIMPYTMSDFRKEVALEVMDELTPEERLRGLTPAQILRALTPAQILRALTPAQIEAYLGRLRKASKGRQTKKRKTKREGS